jgi:hypothetical protein
MVTEDDAVGGLQMVLDKELLRFGLPEAAGLTGLLRHLEGSKQFTFHIQSEHISRLQREVNTQRSQIRLLLQQVEAFENGVRAMRENGQILALFDAEQYSEGLRDRLGSLEAQEPAPESLHERIHEALRTRGKYADSFVAGVKESFPQYDDDYRHVTPEEGHDG